MSRCPHCLVDALGVAPLTRLDQSASLRWRCRVCNGLFVPTDCEAELSHREVGLLVGAQRASSMSFGWKAAGVVLAAMSLMAMALAAALGRLAPLTATLMASLAVTAAVASVCAVKSARARSAESRAKLDEAWQLVAAEVRQLQNGARGASERAAE